MNYLSLPIFLASILVLVFNLLVYIKNRKSNVNQAFAVFGIFIFVWLFCFSLAYKTSDLTVKLFWFKIGYLGIIFIPVTFYAFIFYLLGEVKNKAIVYSNYLIGFIFCFLHFTKYPLVIDVFKYEWGYYPNTLTPLHFIFLFFFMTLFTSSNIFMCIALLKRQAALSEIRYMRIKYALVGSIVGSLAALDFIGSYGIDFPPIGFMFMILYPIIFGYAILKYRLMDVTIAITRTGIFIAVYSLVLGVPFALAFGWQQRLINLFGLNWWIVPLVSSTILATAGPFIYLYVQKRAEDKLLREQRQYQVTLRQASMGMGQIKELKRLLQLIVHIVTRAVSVEHCKIFLFHEESKQFILKASRGKQLDNNEMSILDLDSPLVCYLQEIKEPAVYEEIKQRTQDYKDSELESVEMDISKINGALVIPSFIDQKLIAILVLGKKKSGKLYTQDDLAVFSILANQAGLAIENAQFYERMKETHMQLMKAEKMATVGTMADGLSHQINNRLHAMGFIAGDALDTIRLKKEKKLTKDMKAFLDEIEHSFGRIEDNVKRGGEIVEGLLKYTRKGAEGFETIDLDKLLDAALEMVQFKIKLSEMDIVRNFDDNIPNIQGNFTQLQEVFFNIIDNAYDAMMQRKNELKEPGYKAHLEIGAEQKNQKLEILINDNGIGVKKENLEKLFTPFFTTKLSSKKGTGLGLYVIRQIIEENHGGRVRFTSQYKEGSQTRILLPVAAGDRKE